MPIQIYGLKEIIIIKIYLCKERLGLIILIRLKKLIKLKILSIINLIVIAKTFLRNIIKDKNYFSWIFSHWEEVAINQAKIECNHVFLLNITLINILKLKIFFF